MSECIAHEPCPKCGSKDNLGRFDDGHGFCFGCNYYEHGNGETKRVENTPRDWKPISGEYQDLQDRGLRETTLKFWKYQVGMYKGEKAHIMNVRDEQGRLVAQKFRTAKTKGLWQGDSKDPPLYGAWLWGKGKSITITEGEIDALSMSQAFDNRWPVVSLPNGVGSVKKSLKRAYDYLTNFDKIVLMFDMDEPGRKAVEDAVQLLPSGKEICIANLPEKDANEVLKKHGPAKLVECFWNAQPYRPDGIVMGSDLDFDTLKAAANKGYDIRLTDLNERLLGLRKGEITLLTAASGIGKSTLLRQLCYELHQDHGCSIGNVYLEESNTKTAQAYIALHNNVPLGRLRYAPDILTERQWRDGFDHVIADRMCFYNHFGSLESARLISKLHFMATALKVDFIALDHISIVTSGMESSSEGERKDIDILMTRLRQLVEETGVGILGVVHLKRHKDKNFNEGDQVSLNDLRGSASLEQLSDNVVSMERDQQAQKQTTSQIRVLKCRETGATGASDKVRYSKETGKYSVPVFDPTDEIQDEGATKF